ncbi:amidohydrolase family protein [Sulfitobacter donghicola]|uniref:Amidohydrolase n=1 Tax=Sulfitobacter donghicola DSW-25 = KCTC 12864 = JCM 14565 TaxID=1300350 RepID=A0A073IT85_9RHOB|nr:amidohydrolase family protein [Sulfitobacter donghicola]KEJ88602.1 amidohydrolase [Sulfitobacter donghicola DSW-25 = KCTC 12864 = JCM 14565]KIN68360.1 Amidohydrolase family [Sulfitobacter donghicola DSW-25 = KCTC 12864 = JCM 14565]
MFRKFSLLSAAALSLCLSSGFVAAHEDHDHGDEDPNAPIGEAVHDLPLFDAHIHYKEPAWGPYPVEKVIRLMDNSGVAMGLVSSTPDEGTIELWKYAPNRIVPELRPYHGEANSSNWTHVHGMESYLNERLEKYPHQGIGEFHIRSRKMWDRVLFKSIINTAKERDLFLHVHSGAAPIRWLYGLDKDVKIIWAHAGLGEPPSTVYKTMKKYPNLVADTSLRELAILGRGDDLDPEWKKIVYDFQDRLMIGSDTWVNEQWDRYDNIMASNRAWLAKLPRSIAEKIAYRNAERYFGQDIHMGLIGKR